MSEMPGSISLNISTHVPTRGTTRVRTAGHSPRKHFNPRPHAGDDQFNARFVKFSQYFNPRPHAGDDAAGKPSRASNGISTHVPTRGTTATILGLIGRFDISTHVPTRGTTLAPTAAIQPMLFQPTSPRGGRPVHRASGKCLLHISTHVPTRGTTELASLVRDMNLFQPTSPRGGRPNVRGLERRRSAISTHVPTRGTTFYIRPNWFSTTISTHVPTRGTTLRKLYIW